MSIPSKEQLLEAAVHYIEGELLPSLEGEARFKTRLTLNALRIVHRELESNDSPTLNFKPFNGMDANQLASEIRKGSFSLEDHSLRSHLRASLAQDLTINNPKWLGSR